MLEERADVPTPGEPDFYVDQCARRLGLGLGLGLGLALTLTLTLTLTLSLSLSLTLTRCARCQADAFHASLTSDGPL